MTRNEKLLLAAAVVLVLFGLFMTLGAVINTFDKKSTDSLPADVALFLLLGALPVVVGVWLFIHTRNGATTRALEAREQAVLHLASQHGGALTVPQVTEESGMTLEQAKAVLERLYHKSFAEISLSDSGEMVYRFQM